MSFVFCLRADGSLLEDITEAMCVAWVTTIHPSISSVPGVWSQLPRDLLPDGAAVCYFNVCAFMEQYTPPLITPPLITPRMRERDSAWAIMEQVMARGEQARI